MQNIVDYFLKNQNVSFSALPFNELDAAIFSRLSYINFDNFVSPYKYSKKKLTAIAYILLKNEEKKTFKFDEDKEIIKLIAKSKRYSDIYIKGYIKDTDQNITKQFSATTFIYLGKDISRFILVSFRGTDGSYIGWKEDFEMSYKESIPAQIDAVNYLRKAFRFSRIKNLYVVGHSKGGNLAIYASSYLRKNIQNNIKGIYCFDSPGFNETFLNSDNYKAIKDKILHFAPTASIIGRLLNSDYSSIICESSKVLLHQHNIYNWKIEDSHFLRKTNFDFISDKFNFYLKDALTKLSYEQKEKFVNEVFDVIKDLSVDGEIAFGDSLINFTKRFFKTLKNKSKLTQSIITSIFKQSFEDEKKPDIIEKVKPLLNKEKNNSFFSKLKSLFEPNQSESEKVVLTIEETNEK